MLGGLTPHTKKLQEPQAIWSPRPSTPGIPRPSVTHDGAGTGAGASSRSRTGARCVHDAPDCAHAAVDRRSPRRAHCARPDVRDGRGRDPRGPDSHMEARTAFTARGARAEQGPRRPHVPRVRGRHADLPSPLRGGGNARPSPHRRLRRAKGRPRRDRDAQLPRVVDRVLGCRGCRRSDRPPQRLVDRARARVRAERLGMPSSPSSTTNATSASASTTRHCPTCAASSSPRANTSSRRRRNGSRTCSVTSTLTPSSPTSRSIPRTTRRSSTRRARLGGRRARSARNATSART